MKLSTEYIAGLFDGEGHVSITFAVRRGIACPKLTVKLTNTHLPVLLLVREQYGGTIYAGKCTMSHHLQVHTLSFSVKQSECFIRAMLPHLVIKYEQALVALKFQATIYRRGKQVVSDEEKGIRENCMNEVKKLKKENWPKTEIDNYTSVIRGWIQHRQLIPNHDVKG